MKSGVIKYIIVLVTLISKAISNSNENDPLIKAYTKEIKDRTKLINKEIELLEEALKKENEKIKTLVDINLNQAKHLKNDFENLVTSNSHVDNSIFRSIKECKSTYKKNVKNINLAELDECVSDTEKEITKMIHKAQSKILEPLTKSLKCKTECQKKSQERCTSCYDRFLQEANSLLTEYTKTITNKIHNSFYEGLICVHNKNIKLQDKICHERKKLSNCVEKATKKFEEKSCSETNKNLQFKLEVYSKKIKELEKKLLEHHLEKY